jgi:branched-chain amino acid transport system substrate-binding protein
MSRATWLNLFSMICICSAAVLSSQSLSKSTSGIKIGVISVLTGDGPSWGINHQRGTILAAEDFNATGGVNGKRIQLILEDSPSGSAKNAVSAYSKLVMRNRVRFILGPGTMDELLAIAPLAAKDGVIIGGSTYMPDAPTNFFSTWIDADIETDRIAGHIFERYKRVAILASQESWESHIARRFRETFAKLGGDIVSFKEPSFDAIDVKTEVLQTKQMQPDAIFITSYLLFPKFVKELSTLGITTPRFGIELDQGVIDGSGNGADGVTFIAPSAPSDAFTKRFITRWGKNPDIPAASAYDAAMILFKTIATQGEDHDKTLAELSEIRGYDGVSGRIYKDAGRTVVSTSLYTIQQGRIVPIGEPNPLHRDQ